MLRSLPTAPNPSPATVSTSCAPVTCASSEFLKSMTPASLRVWGVLFPGSEMLPLSSTPDYYLALLSLIFKNLFLRNVFQWLPRLGQICPFYILPVPYTVHSCLYHSGYYKLIYGSVCLMSVSPLLCKQDCTVLDTRTAGPPVTSCCPMLSEWERGVHGRTSGKQQERRGR